MGLTDNVDAAELVKEIKEQEKKGIFKSLRKQEKPQKKSLRNLIQNAPFHIHNAIKLTGEFKSLHPFDRLIVSGVGVNAVAGELLAAYIRDYNYPVVVNREHSMPEWANSKSLAIIASFSGNDDEALLSYRSALRKGCRIIGLASGGRLLEAFKKNSTEHIMLPEIMESCALPYIFFPMLRILENSKLVRPQTEAVEETLKALRKPDILEMAKQLYEKLQDRIPIIYCSVRLRPVAKYWKLQFNTISKVPAFIGVYSDSYHELNSYCRDQWDFYAVFLRDDSESPEIVKSMAAAKKIIRNKGHGTTEIVVKGTNLLTKYISAAHIADHASLLLSEYYKFEEDLVAQYRKDYKAMI